MPAPALHPHPANADSVSLGWDTGKVSLGFFLGCPVRHAESWLPDQDQGWDPCPLRLEARSLNHWTAREGIF